MSDFHRTRMGVTYYERTLPELVEQLTRIADLLERTLAQSAPAPTAERKKSKEDP